MHFYHNFYSTPPTSDSHPPVPVPLPVPLPPSSPLLPPFDPPPPPTPSSHSTPYPMVSEYPMPRRLKQNIKYRSQYESVLLPPLSRANLDLFLYFIPPKPYSISGTTRGTTLTWLSFCRLLHFFMSPRLPRTCFESRSRPFNHLSIAWHSSSQAAKCLYASSILFASSFKLSVESTIFLNYTGDTIQCVDFKVLIRVVNKQDIVDHSQ